MTTSESMLRAALALARDSIFVIDAETMGYLEFNDATCRMSGRTREDLNRLGPVGMWTQTGGTPQALRQHYDTLIAQSPEPMSHVTAVHRPDGSFIKVWMDRVARRIDGRWVIIACARELPGAGPEGGEGEDVDTLRARLHASPDAVSLIDYQGMRYIDVNAAACEILGYSRDELLEGDLPLSGDRTLDDLRDLYAALIMRSPLPMTEETVYDSSNGTRVRTQATRRAILADGMWLIQVQAKRLPEKATATATATAPDTQPARPAAPSPDRSPRPGTEKE